MALRNGNGLDPNRTAPQRCRIRLRSNRPFRFDAPSQAGLLLPSHLTRRWIRDLAGDRWDREILSGHPDSRRIAAKVPPARTIIAVTLWDAHDACTCKSTGFGTEFIYL